MSSTRRTMGFVQTGRRIPDPNWRACTCGNPFRKTIIIYRRRLARESQGWRPGQNTEDYPVNIICDACGEAIESRGQGEVWTFNCQECDVDICEDCDASTLSTAELIRRNQRNQSSSSAAGQRPVIEACCMVAIAQTSDPITAAARGQRYNGRRPNYQDRRVSRRDYPDPVDFGWTFTGSCEGGRAEFFERDFGAQVGVVKLDFYYTTGTVKTVLDHLTQGVTQLFAKGSDLSPQLYRQILRNPREHTNVRYHRRG